MEQLIDLLRKYIVLNKTICKDIQGAISEVSSDDFSEEDLLDYYETIPSEDKSLIYACLAKILNYKEYLLSKDIEKIAKSWDDIKVGSKPFHVPYVINTSSFKNSIEKYKAIKSSNVLIQCLNAIYGKKVDKGNQYDTIYELLKKIAAKIEQPALEPYMSMARTGTGKTYCEIPSKIAKLIYEEWEKIYNENKEKEKELEDKSKEKELEDIDKDKEKELKNTEKEKKSKDEQFLEIFSDFDKDISTFFRAFRIGIDCSGYVNQVYAQWMFDHGKTSTKEMIETIGPNKDKTKYVYKEGHKCRDNCMAIREEEFQGVKYSLHHIGYFFVNDKAKTPSTHKYKKKNSETGEVEEITEHPTHPKKDRKYTRTGPLTYIESGKSTSDAAEKVVMSKLKAGDLICLEHNYHNDIAHYVIVEKTGIDENGQWYFCVTESSEADKIRWKDPITKKKTNETTKWNGVRHDQGYYTSIEDYINTRKSGYEFFWFCRPKAIAEYYDNNTIIEYKEEEKKKS